MPCGTVSEGAITPADAVDYYTSCDANGCTYNNIVRTAKGSVSYKSASGACTPNFHARRNRGELLPMTPWTQIEISSTGVHGSSFTGYKIGQSGWWSVDTPQAHGLNPPVTPWYITEGEVDVCNNFDFSYEVQKAAASIASSGHDTLTFLAELGKTRKMFIDFVKRLASGRYPRGVQDIANAWLEWRYGWRTLLYDLDNLAEAVANLEYKRTRYSKRQGTSHSWTDSSTEDSVTSVGTYRFVTTYDYTVSVRGSVTADISPSSFQFNPVQTAWELVPWSFVVDWLINVGQALSAITFLTTNAAYVAAGGYYVTLTKTCTKSWPIKATYYSGNFDVTATSDATLVKRVPTTVTSIPQVRLRLDEWKGLDILSFLLQRR